ncbi:hypothetical protein [Mycoplasma suis]|uniref:Uncharacterized protein n=1 Tax=Mycoplasma suis (strain Illinois) TaxID=768700 RepID=F0QRY7_MYCSL|nr:hypothetical protein [Mycoplasma suis]ADX98257.1 hypothetical protein MSU_0732 [Mycoplasma suis str. Illinois]
MRSYRGGGLAASALTREFLTQDLSKPLFQFLDLLREWFPSETSKPQEEGAEASSSQQQEFSIWSKLESIWEIVWSFTKSSAKGTVKSFKELFTTIKKLKNKEWQSVIPEEQEQLLKSQNSSNGQSQDSQQQVKTNWRDFFNGFWIICHFAYRDVFKVEIGSVFYLLGSTLIDISQWKWEWESIERSIKNMENKLQERIKETLKFLAFLNVAGKLKREQMKKQNNGEGDNQQNKQPYSITRNAIKWANYVYDESSSKPEPSSS